MEHLLDNLVWNSLNTGNKDLAKGTDKAKFYPSEISPFAGLEENTPKNLQTLYDLTPPDRSCAFPTIVELDLKPWNIIQRVDCVQMVCDNPISRTTSTEPLITLTDEHIPQMLALTKLTNPGPFAERTIDFGHYRGIFDGDKLVAMAGQRMNPTPYAEVSAVCTHPDYLGRGYAAQLVLWHANRIREAGEIPILHALATNTRAIKLYESLGFKVRRELYIYAINKK